MRERFELYVKVVGLVVFCWGLITSLHAIPLLLHPLDADVLLPTEALKGDPYLRQMRDDFQAGLSRTFAWMVVHLVVSGIMPMLFGIFLMRWGRLVVRFCYPQADTGKHPNPEPVNLKLGGADETAAGAPVLTDAWYAPPGYFQ